MNINFPPQVWTRKEWTTSFLVEMQFLSRLYFLRDRENRHHFLVLNFLLHVGGVCFGRRSGRWTGRRVISELPSSPISLFRLFSTDSPVLCSPSAAWRKTKVQIHKKEKKGGREGTICFRVFLEDLGEALNNPGNHDAAKLLFVCKLLRKYW